MEAEWRYTQHLIEELQEGERAPCAAPRRMGIAAAFLPDHSQITGRG